MSCGVGRKRGLDLAWLWLWRRLAATTLIRPLAWGRPYAMGVALKKKKDKRFSARELLCPQSEPQQERSGADQHSIPAMSQVLPDPLLKWSL